MYRVYYYVYRASGKRSVMLYLHVPRGETLHRFTRVFRQRARFLIFYIIIIIRYMSSPFLIRKMFILYYCSTAILLVSCIFITIILCMCAFYTRNRIRDKVSAIIRHLQQPAAPVVVYSVVYTTRPGRDVNICLLFYRGNQRTPL